MVPTLLTRVTRACVGLDLSKEGDFLYMYAVCINVCGNVMYIFDLKHVTDRKAMGTVDSARLVKVGNYILHQLVTPVHILGIQRFQSNAKIPTWYHIHTTSHLKNPFNPDLQAPTPTFLLDKSKPVP